MTNLQAKAQLIDKCMQRWESAGESLEGAFRMLSIMLHWEKVLH